MRIWLWLLLSPLAYADFSVEGQPPAEGYVQAVTYTPVAKHAPIVINDQRDRREESLPQPFHRPYFRFRGSVANLSFKYIKNMTPGSNALPTNKRLSLQERQMSAAWGYLNDNISSEIELYVPKSFNYIGNPVLVSGANFAYVAHIKTTALFANANYLLADFHYVQPYLSVGVGLAVKSINAEAYNGATGKRSYPSFNGGWNVGAGLAFQVSKDIGLDVSYRLVDLGRTKLNMVEETSRVALESRSAQVYGYALGIFYRF